MELFAFNEIKNEGNLDKTIVAVGGAPHLS
jgi:hypothetical protein